MNKNIFKILLISFIVLFSALFINIDGVKARSCSCFYSGELKEDGAPTIYAAKVVYTDEVANQACVDKNHCTYRSGWDSSVPKIAPGYVADLCEARTTGGKCLSQGQSPKADYPFIKASIQRQIVHANCSVEACQQAPLRFKSTTTLGNNVSKILRAANGSVSEDNTIESSGVSVTAYLDAISRENYNKLINAENLVDEAENQGIHGGNTSIRNWAKIALEGEYELGEVGSVCNSISDIGEYISNLLWIIDIIAIIILIIMTAMDFIRAVVGSEEDTLKKAFKSLVIRAIIIVILFLLPLILGAIIRMMNTEAGVIEIGENGQIFCNVAKDK